MAPTPEVPLTTLETAQLPQKPVAGLSSSESSAAPAVELSPEAKAVSDQIRDALVEGKPVEKAQIDALVDRVKEQLQKQGVTVSEDDEKYWRQNTQELFDGKKEEPPKPLTREQKVGALRDFKHYMREFDRVSREYGLDKKGWKLGTLESILSLSRGLRGYGLQHIIEDVLRNKRVRSKFPWDDELLEKTRTTVGAINLEDTNPKQMNVKHLVEGFSDLRAHKNFRALTDEQKSIMVKYRLLEKLPFLFAYVSLPMGSLERAVYRQFTKEFQGVRHQLNERIASSLFMRDFEFIHDHSAHEIFERIDRGKRGVVTLLSTTYLDIIPRLAEMAGATIPVARKNWIVGALSLLRVPILMKESGQKVHEVLGMHKDDVGTWVDASTKISSLLYGAELVKTDDVEEAAKEFVASLDAHDALAYPAERRKSKEEKRHIALSRVFNLGVPAVSVGWKAFKDRLKNQNKTPPSGDTPSPKKPRIGLQDIAFHGLGAIGELVGTHRQQEILEQKVGEIVGIYEAHIKQALADIRQMEEFLGPQDALDTPNGVKEESRIPVSDLPDLSLHVENLRYKNILQDISFDIPQGSFTAITGPKGTGKTTLVRALMGLYNAESGSVQYGGVALSDIKKYGDQAFTTKIAYANQNPLYFENMTLRDNLLLWSHRTVSDEKISQILNELGMEKYADKLDGTFKHYSGGELRMIGLARALIKDPHILFLDEPTSNLDPESAQQVTEVIGRMREKRPTMTVVAVTHDKHFADIADQKFDFRALNKEPLNGNGSLNDHQVFEATAKAEDA